MITTKILSNDPDPDDDELRSIVDSTAYVYPDHPVRYPPETEQFATWVRGACRAAGIPDAAADTLIALARAEIIDVYPRIYDGEVVICPADLAAWQRTHKDTDEPRQTLAAWWEEHR